MLLAFSVVDWIFEHISWVIGLGVAAVYWFKAWAESRLAQAAERKQRERIPRDTSSRAPWEETETPPEPPPPLPNWRPAGQPPVLPRREVVIRQPAAVVTVTAARPQPPPLQQKSAQQNSQNSAQQKKKKRRTLAGETTAPATVRQRLRSRREVRRAIVMQEILAPPVSLRPPAER